MVVDVAVEAKLAHLIGNKLHRDLLASRYVRVELQAGIGREHGEVVSGKERAVLEDQAHRDAYLDDQPVGLEVVTIELHARNLHVVPELRDPEAR